MAKYRLHTILSQTILEDEVNYTIDSLVEKFLPYELQKFTNTLTQMDEVDMEILSEIIKSQVSAKRMKEYELGDYIAIKDDTSEQLIISKVVSVNPLRD